MQKLNDISIALATRASMTKLKMKDSIKLNKKGINVLVEVAGVLAIVVAAVILVLPQAKSAVASIWNSVTTNAKNFFTNETI